MYLVKNVNPHVVKVAGKTVEGTYVSGTTPGDMTKHAEDAKHYKTEKAARAATTRLYRSFAKLLNEGKISSRTNDVEKARPDYEVVEYKAKTTKK